MASDWVRSEEFEYHLVEVITSVVESEFGLLHVKIEGVFRPAFELG